MKTIKITLTPEQHIQLARAAALEIDLPDYDQLANELHSTKTTLEAIAALLNPNGYTGLSLVELLHQRLAEAACEGFNAGFLSIGNLTKQNKDYIDKKKSDFIERKYKIKIRKSL